MKGSSKVIMGATMAIVIVLAVVLALVLVLLAELYCSLLFRRRKLSKTSKPTSMAQSGSIPQAQHQPDSGPSPLSSFYSQGVLDAPRSFLFPKLPSKKELREDGDAIDIEKQKHGKLHQFLSIQSPQPHQIGLPSSPSSPSASPSPLFTSLAKSHEPNNKQQPEIEDEGKQGCQSEEAFCGGSKGENFMYISNPIYDNDVGRTNRADQTPFETPDSSPSRFDQSGSSGEEEAENAATSSPSSLPLTPIKELPAKASSVALRNARSLGTSGSDCNSHVGRSSSSSGSPCTSPSW